jgi:hypothetical protein
LIVGFNCEVKSTVVFWYCYIVAVVFLVHGFSIVPVAGITLGISNMSDFEISDAVVPVGCFSEDAHWHRENTLIVGNSWVNTERNLRNESICPVCIIMGPCFRVIGNAPRVSHQQHIDSCGSIDHLECCQNGVSMSLSNSAIISSRVTCSLCSCAHRIVLSVCSFDKIEGGVQCESFICPNINCLVEKNRCTGNRSNS